MRVCITVVCMLVVYIVGCALNRMQGSTAVRPLITSCHSPLSYGSPAVDLMLNKFAGNNFKYCVCACV